MKYIKTNILLFIMGICALVSCSHDPALPYPLEDILDSQGSFVRILTPASSINSQFDGNNVSGETFSFNFEVYDPENGALSESVSFFAKFVSPVRKAVTQEIELTDKKTSVSSLSPSGETGLPSGSFSVSYSELNSLLAGRSLLDSESGADKGETFSIDEIFIGDRFDIRWALQLKDGTTITNSDMTEATGDISGFYKSPFEYNIEHLLIIPEDRFVGEYEITQLEKTDSVSVLADSTNGWLFGESKTNTITLEAGGNLSRTFEIYLGVVDSVYINGQDTTFNNVSTKFELGFVPQLVNGGGKDNVTLTGEVSTDFKCEIGLFYGPAQIASGEDFNDKGEFDFNDDSNFTFVIRENPANDCGYGAKEYTFTAEKVE